MLRTTISTSLVLLSVLGFAIAPATAQVRENQRGYVAGFGGAGATSEVTSPFFGGSVGLDLTRNLLLTVDFGRIQDVEPSFTVADLATGDQEMKADGFRASSSIKVPTNFLSGGFRFRFANDRRVQPYLLAHGGIAHMSPVPKFTVEGIDVTSLLLNDEDPYVRKIFREETRPMGTVGGGISAQLTDHVLVDLGYKYSAIFIKKNFLQDYEASPHAHSRIDTHRLYAGIGLTF